MTTVTASASGEILERYRQVQALDQQKHAILRELLDDLLTNEGRVFVTRAQMGYVETDSTRAPVPSFVGSVSLRWIGERIKPASQMPLLRNKLDEQGRLIIDHDTVNELRQRAPDWSREATLAHYLLKSPLRKFPALLVVVSERWVDDPGAEEWDHPHVEGARAKRTSMPFAPLDSEGRVGMVDFRDISMYAADGMHRSMGAKAVMDLLRQTYLVLKDRAGKEIGRETQEELAERYGLNDAEMQQIEHESMGIEFIPAVIAGETREEARRRVRSVFVNVNKSAKRPTQGAIALLDEDDGFAIIARQIGLRHPLFQRDAPGDRVNWNTSALPRKSKWLTSLVTLQEVGRDYLALVRPYSSWLPTRPDEIPLRPEEKELEQGFADLKNLWDHIAALPSFADIARSGNIDEWREFPNKVEGGKGHLLMRPLGQLILARAVGSLHLKELGPRLPLDKIFEKLTRYDQNGGFETTAPSNAWFGVTYDFARDRMNMAGRDAAVKLLIYLVYGIPQRAEREALLEAFRSFRSAPGENGERMYYNYDGKIVDDPDDVQLPPMI